MEVSDPRKRYLSLISLDKSNVILSPPIIFLFGGKIDDPPLTVRGILYKHILIRHTSLSNNLIIPEDFKDWLHDSVYPDLLLFESDLAQTSSLIIIALESPGAIAELGSFSVNSDLKNKVVVIISEHHHSQDSFIRLGPLRQIPESNIYSYPYDHTKIGTSLDDYLDDIVDSIKINITNLNKTEKFNKPNNGHVALLIYELVSMFKALKISEIQEYLLLLDIQRKENELKRLLFLLDKLSLVVKKRRGNIDYFLPKSKQQRINFSSRDTIKLFDRSSALIGTAEFYASSSKERMRKLVIDEHAIGGKSNDNS